MDKLKLCFQLCCKAWEAWGWGALVNIHEMDEDDVDSPESGWGFSSRGF